MNEKVKKSHVLIYAGVIYPCCMVCIALPAYWMVTNGISSYGELIVSLEFILQSCFLELALMSVLENKRRRVINGLREVFLFSLPGVILICLLIVVYLPIPRLLLACYLLPYLSSIYLYKMYHDRTDI